MQTTNLTDAKNRLSELVERARSGERVRILVRGTPAADLVPIATAGAGGDEDRLASLERRGLIVRGRGAFPELLLEPGPRPRGEPASATLLTERDERP